MTWYADLSPCDYFGAQFAGHLKAVGWLARGQAFMTGEVSESIFEKLCQLLQQPWCPVFNPGVHYCELCRFTGGSGVGQFRSYRVSGVSGSSLFVPGNGFLYVAPVAIAHYIDAHCYRPPEEFCAAVVSCPEMRSVGYLKLVLANGGCGFTAGDEPKSS
jgi:hypothetical protein